MVGEKSRNLALRRAHRVRSTHCGGVAGRARPAGRAQCDAPRRPLRAARTTAVASCRTAIRQVQRPVVSRPRRPQGRQAARRARAVNTHRKGVERAQAHGRAHREDAMTATARCVHHHGRPTPRTKGGAEASAVLRPRRPRGREAASLPRSVCAVAAVHTPDGGDRPMRPVAWASGGGRARSTRAWRAQTAHEAARKARRAQCHGALAEARLAWARWRVGGGGGASPDQKAGASARGRAPCRSVARSSWPRRPCGRAPCPRRSRAERNCCSSSGMANAMRPSVLVAAQASARSALWETLRTGAATLRKRVPKCNE